MIYRKIQNKKKFLIYLYSYSSLIRFGKLCRCGKLSSPVVVQAISSNFHEDNLHHERNLTANLNAEQSV